MDSDNRSRILQAAYNMFNSRGYRNVTIKDLADSLRMSKKTIYQYFASKEELAAAVVKETMERFNQTVGTCETVDPIHKVKEIIMQAKDEYMWFSPLFLMDIELFLPNLATEYKQFRNQKKQDIIEFLKIAQDWKSIREMPLPLVAEVLSVCLKALARNESFSKNRMSTLDAIDLFIEIFCSGITSSNVNKEDAV